LPEGFHNQTGQRIRGSIRKQNPIETNAEMEVKTNQRDWLSETGESVHKRFGGT